MPVRVICPACKQMLLLADEGIGLPCRCTQCQTVFKVKGGVSPPPQPSPKVQASAKSPAAPRSHTSAERSKAVVPQKQKQGVQEGKTAAAAYVNGPSARKSAPVLVRQGVSWKAVLLIALACFAAGFLSGGGTGFLVSRATAPLTPLSGPVALVVSAKDHQAGSTTALAPVSTPTSQNTDPPAAAPAPKAPPIAEAPEPAKPVDKPKPPPPDRNNRPADNPALRNPNPAPRTEPPPAPRTEPPPAPRTEPPAAPRTEPPPAPRTEPPPAPRTQPPPAESEPPAIPGGPFELPTSPGGFVLMPDNVTFIVSIPARAQLIYFDTLADKELKRVTLDFKPADMALRGKNLIVVQKGASLLHVLDADSGKHVKEVRVPGEPLDHVSCASARGPVFVSNGRKEIYAVNPDNGSALKTSAVGQFVAASPDGKFLYTGSQDPIREQLVIRRQGRNSRVSLQKTGRHAHLMKYAIQSGNTNLVATNGNASINGTVMRLSPDGKRIALPGGGGWESSTQNRRSYSIALWDTKDLETMLGQVELGIYPRNIAFHPVLNLVAADKNGDTVLVYNGKSLAEVKNFKVNAAPGQFTPFCLTFGGKGSKVIYVSASARRERGQPGVNFDENPTQLHFLPLELSAEDKAALEKAYGKP